MKIKLRQSRRVTRILFALLLLYPFINTNALHANTSDASAAAGGANFTFPRIGNYYAYDRAGMAPIFTRYGLVIVPDRFSWTNPAAIAALRSANPSAAVLAYDDPAVIYYTELDRYGANAIYPGWFALKAGTRLTNAISSTQTSIAVADGTKFAVYDDILVDSESMHITAINGNTLTVVRGFYSSPAAHAANARIASHAYIPLGGPSLDNHDLAHQRPWLLNESSVCPTDPVRHQTWLQFFEQWVKTTVLGVKQADGVTPLWSGLFLDDTNDVLYYPADLNNDGVNDFNGTVNGVNVWSAGIAQFYGLAHTDLPSMLLLGNGPDFTNFSSANGQELYEPSAWSTMSLYGGMMASYHTHMAKAVAPDMSFLHPNTPSGSPNPQLMRFGLASALLDNGVYVYDRGATQEGTPWWFDEYDNGAGTALTAAVGMANTTIPVVRASLFNVGDVVEVEDELMRVVGRSGNSLTVTRAVNGTLAGSHDSGAVIATPGQVQAGLGYLGQPLGPAYTVGVNPTNYVPNGSFESGQPPWNIYSKSSPPATISLDSTGAADGAKSAKVTVPVAGTYDSDVGVFNKGLSMVGGKSYTLSFDARSTVSHKVHVLVMYGSPQQTIADATVGVGSTWTQFSIPFNAPAGVTAAEILFALADVSATTWLDGVSVFQTSNPVQRRDFSNGTVLVNASAGSQSVDLSAAGPFCHLRGDQNPALNNGSLVTSVTIQPDDGMILTRCAAPGLATATLTAIPVPPTAAPSATVMTTLTTIRTATANPSATFVPSTPQPSATSVPATSTPSGVSTALVPNGGFESGQSPWLLYSKTSPPATLALDTTTAAVASTSARVIVPRTGSYDSDDGLYDTPISLTSGKRYTVSFYAKCLAPHTVHLILEYGSSSRVTFGDFKAAVGTSWAKYSFAFTMPVTVSNATALFALADIPTTTWLDEVSIS